MSTLPQIKTNIVTFDRVMLWENGFNISEKNKYRLVSTCALFIMAKFSAYPGYPESLAIIKKCKVMQPQD